MPAATVPPGQDRFVTAMQSSQLLLSQWEAGELSEEVLADRVAALVVDRDGARGFFVVAMTAEIPLLDRLPDSLLLVLRQAGEPVVDLTVRNLVMSTAMALHHQRSEDEEQRQGSLRVQGRACELLRQLDAHAVLRRLEPMLAAARLEASASTQAEGLEQLPLAMQADLAMFDRWGYDPAQRAAIAQALEGVAEPV
ncbi:MAG: hypothetical protein VKK62_03880 [Synechococcaceae cyanobacterium]|nr:hypothetical protein [Synechococcaceae cyanobacterium]